MQMTCYLDLLPAELLAQIASADRAVYWPLAVGYPRFGRSLTAGRRVDFAIGFGHDVRVKRGKCSSYVEWKLNGHRHRTDGPAMQADTFDVWYDDNILHREGGPAIYCRHCGSEMWFNNGDFHRNGAPAAILYSSLKCSHKYDFGKFTTCFANRVKQYSRVEIWANCLGFHRKRQPAVIAYDSSGEIAYTDHWRNGKRADVNSAGYTDRELYDLTKKFAEVHGMKLTYDDHREFHIQY